MRATSVALPQFLPGSEVPALFGLSAGSAETAGRVLTFVSSVLLLDLAQLVGSPLQKTTRAASHLGSAAQSAPKGSQRFATSLVLRHLSEEAA